MEKKEEKIKKGKGWYEVKKGVKGVQHAMTGLPLMEGEKHFIEHEHATSDYFTECEEPKKGDHEEVKKEVKVDG